MKFRWWNVLGLVLVAAAVSGGCARAARDTHGFATVTTATVQAPMTETWQATKTVLRERQCDIYTRDKRGLFVAYTSPKRRIWVTPKRIQYTISLEPHGEKATRVTVETMRQVYGVAPLTYPGWHDRKTTDDTEARAVLEAIQAKTAGA